MILEEIGRGVVDCQHTGLTWHCHMSCLLSSQSACHTALWTPLGHRGAPSGRAGPPPHWQGLPQTPYAGHHTPARTHLHVTLLPSAFQPAMPLDRSLSSQMPHTHTHTHTPPQHFSSQTRQTQVSWFEFDRLAPTRQLFRQECLSCWWWAMTDGQKASKQCCLASGLMKC